MKIPSVPLTIVYKVVRINRRGTTDKFNGKIRSTRMFSANAGAKLDGEFVVEYKLRHQTFPRDDSGQALFVCSTLEEAKTWWRMFEMSFPCHILRGYAANVRRRYADEIPMDPAFKNHTYFGYTGDWFIPIGIVVKSTHY